MNEELMRQGGLGDFVDKVKEGKCPFCEKPVRVEDFRDPLSLQDYRITGLCQKCQDEFYGTDPFHGSDPE